MCEQFAALRSTQTQTVYHAETRLAARHFTGNELETTHTRGPGPTGADCGQRRLVTSHLKRRLPSVTV